MDKKMEKLGAYRIFELEMKELMKFFNATKFAFYKTREIRHFIQNKDHKQYLDDNGFDTKLNGICSFKKNAILNLERTLNHQTLIRAISALEIFLVDIFRDIFIITKIPFKNQSKIHKYNQSQILSIKSVSELFNQIINKECRKLSSGGFGEIIKAYKKKLNIDLLHIPPGKQKMIEYHEIRHLIIHRLGRTDAQFRKKYHITNKDGISINEEYLINCIKDIKRFANQTHILVINRINELKNPDSQEVFFERKVKYRIEILESDSNLNFLNAEFEFWVNDEFEVLKNILIAKKTLSDNKFELSLAGTKRQIRAYYSHLKYAKKKHIINLTTEYINESNRKIVPLEDDILELVRQQLPKQPWETGIHKKVAEKLGLKNKVVSTAIKILINRNIFKQQVDGILIEDKKRNIKTNN